MAQRLRARGLTVQGTTRRSLDLENPDALDALCGIVTPGIRVLHSIPTLAGDLDRLAVGALKGAARVVYLSTTGVYGDTECVDENTPAAPVTDRAHARLRTERAVLDGTWSAMVLRPAAIYGPTRIVSYARTSGCVSRIHVDDLAAHAEAALFSDITGAWPVADDYPCPSQEILDFLGAESGAGGNRPSPVRQTGRRVNGVSVRSKLGVSLTYPSYREGIPASLPSCRIFLAEDNTADVYLIREAFRQHDLNCDLHVVDNGEDALRYIQRIGKGQDSRPHLLLLDLNLPRVDRGEILRQCRENPDCASLPLIVLSSVDMERDLRSAGHLHESSLFFRKPADLDAFLELGAIAKRILHQAID